MCACALQGIRLAVIVMHGADRNADDYFCDMLNLTSYQTAIPASQVAPHNEKKKNRRKK